MNIVVCVKQTVDLQQVRIRKETRQPVLENIPLTLGPSTRAHWKRRCG